MRVSRNAEKHVKFFSTDTLEIDFFEGKATEIVYSWKVFSGVLREVSHSTLGFDIQITEAMPQGTNIFEEVGLRF